jgi:hypothetical protein
MDGEEEGRIGVSECLKFVGVVDECAAMVLIDHPVCCCYRKGTIKFDGG